AHVVSTLKALGVDTDGLSLGDCSGLSSDNRISGRTLAQTLRTGMTSQRPDLRDLVRSLPWGGLDGTLDTRFTTGEAAANVQAKTGSLSTVSSLAGVVTTSGGRTLVFAVGNDAVPDDGAYWTRGVLDDFVQGLSAL
ncbi:D-alanyl-D-alanine carboxypeptidase, partial [Tsukamurella conjunctivitidis]